MEKQGILSCRQCGYQGLEQLPHWSPVAPGGRHFICHEPMTSLAPPPEAASPARPPCVNCSQPREYEGDELCKRCRYVVRYDEVRQEFRG